MATRNRTLVYLQFRNEKKSFRREGGVGVPMGKGYSNVAKQKLLDKDELEEVEEGNKTQLKLPPPWMSTLDDINYDIAQIKRKMNELSACHTRHLKPQFAEGMDDEQTIEILTDQITKLFQKSQGRLARLKRDRVPESEESVKKNMLSTLASQIQELSLQFRKEQKDYLQRLKGRQQKGRMFSIEEDSVGDDDTHFEVLFTKEQSQAVASSEELVSQREQSIKQIAKSINELAGIFKDLSILVIEQGTILDRIDFNLEQTETHLERAGRELDKAAQHQKKYRNKICMLLLCIGILIMLLVILIQFFRKV